MTDTVVKGSGNSRSIKSVPNLAALAPTYDKLLELLTGEGLPIDLGPLNPAGLNVLGTDLNKASLLKDETAALYGLGADAVPDEVFSIVAPGIAALSKKCNVEYGSVVTVGGNTTVTFSFKPLLVVFCWGNSSNLDYYLFLRPHKGRVIPGTGRYEASWGSKNVQVSIPNNGEYYYISIG